MAERRMFSKTIVDSDAFLDMPTSAQSLYFHLSMRADDEGFVNNPKRITRMVGSSEDDLKILLAKRFILGFESGVIVIKHWKINNYIKKDRFKSSVFNEERKMLSIKDNGSYTLCLQNGDTLETNWIQNGDNLDTQDSIGKYSIGKYSIGESIGENPSHNYGQYFNITLTDEELEKLKQLFPTDWSNKIDRISVYCQSKGKTYKDYFATICNWAKQDEEKTKKGSFDTDEFFNAALEHTRNEVG